MSSTRRQDEVPQRMPASTSKIVTEGCDEEQEIVVDGVQADTHYLSALVAKRPHVDVLAVLAHLHQLHCHVAVLVDGVGQVDPQDTAGADKAFEVVSYPEEIELLLLLVPVATDALEYGSAIVECVGHNADFGVCQGHELFLEIRVGGCHWAAPFGVRGQIICCRSAAWQAGGADRTHRCCSCASWGVY